MNAPLLHATTALAARFAEHHCPPTALEARGMAREIASAFGLDRRDREALLGAADRLAAPLEDARRASGLGSAQFAAQFASTALLVLDRSEHSCLGHPAGRPRLETVESIVTEAGIVAAAPLDELRRPAARSMHAPVSHGVLACHGYAPMSACHPVHRAAVATMSACHPVRRAAVATVTGVTVTVALVVAAVIAASVLGQPAGEGRQEAHVVGRERPREPVHVGAAILVDTVIGANVDGARVEIVGTDQAGPAPFTARLEHGKWYKARIMARGFAWLELEVTGGDVVPRVKLVPKPQIIAIDSDPSGALIWIDDQASGHATPFELELTAAQSANQMVHIRLRKNGYNPIEQVIDLGSSLEEDTRLVVKLEAKLSVSAPNGHLVITSTPRARIAIDGVDTGISTPITGPGLPVEPGMHRVTFSIGPDRFTFSKRVASGETVVMDKQLE
jgi:hypothetical protein